jgi:hypothetical protein
MYGTRILINLFPTLRRKSNEYSARNVSICNARGDDQVAGVSCNFHWQSRMKNKLCKWKCLEFREIVAYLLVHK